MNLQEEKFKKEVSDIGNLIMDATRDKQFRQVMLALLTIYTTIVRKCFADPKDQEAAFLAAIGHMERAKKKLEQ